MRPQGMSRQAANQKDQTGMRRHLSRIALAASLLLGATPALAACYADYRAKMEPPLRLHYGVIALPPEACSIETAAPVIAARIAVEGWDLLQVVSVFDDAGLATRRADAAAYFLRY